MRIQVPANYVPQQCLSCADCFVAKGEGPALLLEQIRSKYGYEQIGQGRLTNDALIARSASRLGITVITANRRDFSGLAEFRTFQWELIGV